jgi:hypothetical protein
MTTQPTEEKYFMLNNMNEFLFIIRCNHDKFTRVIDYGAVINRNPNDSFNISDLTEWLKNHRIAFRAEYLKVHNPKLKKTVLNAIEDANRTAIRNNLFIHNNEKDNLLKKLENGNKDMLWKLDVDLA